MSNLLLKLKNKVLNEPVVITALLADVVLWVASERNIIIDEAQAEAYIAPVVLALIQRLKVTPTRKVV